MFDDLAKLIFDYCNSYKLADSNFVNNTVRIIANYYHLNEYINELLIISNSKQKIYEGSSYDLNKLKLTIDLSCELDKNKYKINNINKRIIYYNLEIIRILFHEFDHIILRRQFDINTNTIDVVLSKNIFDLYYKLSNNTLNSNQKIQKCCNDIILTRLIEYYYFNHNKAPFERRANIRSLLYIYELINILNETKYKKSIKFYKHKCLNKYKKIIKENYKLYRKYNFTNSPSFDYFIKINHNDINDAIKLYKENKEKSFIVTSNNYSLYERILYGLQISEDELNEIKHSKKILYRD